MLFSKNNTSPSPLNKTALPRSGFSLIELLVVIVIIAILATITIPVTGSIRKSANLAECASNLRSIGAALNLHIADNEGNYPVTATADTSVRWTRNTTFTPYLPLERRAPTGGNWENKVFVSPASTNAAGESGPSKLRVTYAASAAMIGGSTSENIGTNRALARKVDSIVNPSQTILLYQGKITTGGNNTNYSHLWRDVRGDIGQEPHMTTRLDYPHNGRMNVLMADGSVHAITPDVFARVTEERFRGME